MGDILEFKPLNDFAAELISLSGYKKFSIIAKFITENAVKISGADRACLVVKRGKELIIEGGFPSEEHGIGERLTSEIGKDFLKQTMENQVRVMVLNPAKDWRTAYLRGIVAKYNIQSILFIPLYIKEESLGVLVLDFIRRNNERTHEEKKRWFAVLGFMAHHIARGIEGNNERRKREFEIKRLQKLALVGEYADRVSHSIRNALLPVIGFADRLKKRTSNLLCAEGGVCKEYADIIFTDTRKAEKILNDVLAFTQPVSLNCAPVNINQFLEQFIAKLEKSGSFKIKFTKELDKNLNCLRVYCDIKKIEQCLDDLVMNAAHEQVGATRVRIVSRFNANLKKTVISVINNGNPIGSQTINKIFEPFMTTKADGTGLGLANVKAIVDAHNGEITAMNKKYGTEFTISLPFYHSRA